MSNKNRGPQPSTQIALVSNSDSFHTTLLLRYLNEQFEAGCSLLKPHQKIRPQTQLVLVDCFQANGDTLNTVMRELSAIPDTIRAALLNTEHNSDHENLLDWPCVFGLFYADTPEDQLIRGLQQLLDGDYWVPRKLLHHFFNKHRQTNSKPEVKATSVIQLTNREREILKMIKNGMSNSAVSESLALSEHTVKSHLYNIYKKIGVRNRMEASNWARNLKDLDAL